MQTEPDDVPFLTPADQPPPRRFWAILGALAGLVAIAMAAAATITAGGYGQVLWLASLAALILLLLCLCLLRFTRPGRRGEAA